MPRKFYGIASCMEGIRTPLNIVIGSSPVESHQIVRMVHHQDPDFPVVGSDQTIDIKFECVLPDSCTARELNPHLLFEDGALHCFYDLLEDFRVVTDFTPPPPAPVRVAPADQHIAEQRTLAQKMRRLKAEQMAEAAARRQEQEERERRVKAPPQSMSNSTKE